jgi:hypothetical protein
MREQQQNVLDPSILCCQLDGNASEPAKTTQGMKALMLKVLEPFFKKKRVGYIMPVKITGTYEQPLFGLDLESKTPKSGSR